MFMDWETQRHVCLWGMRLVSHLSGVTKSQIAETLGKKDACVGGLALHAIKTYYQLLRLAWWSSS